MHIPIVIICYNNYKYVENTIKQLINVNKKLEKDIIIMDNKSMCPNTKKFLLETKYKVILNVKNVGPWVTHYQNAELYELLPEKFILTDPDLQLNPKLPSNFIEILSSLSDKFNTYKIGFSLDISDFDDKMYKNTYHLGFNIYENEISFWSKKINDKTYELYQAPIDTTFSLIKKTGNINIHIRIAGDFTCKHIPWYIDNPIYNIYETYKNICNNTEISTTSKMIANYVSENYMLVNKNDVCFLIKYNKEDTNLSFWENNFCMWEPETFSIFDRFLSIDKVFIDIGAWIGTTGIYGCRKSRHVFLVEADPISLISLKNNCKNNCDNYTIIDKAIYKDNNIDIKIGKNLHLINSKMNDSTSQIYSDNETSDDYYTVKTITLKNIIETNKIDYKDISLIKVDIIGGEEHILSELLDIYSKYNIPMYISFYYSWWKDKNLDRFPLSIDVKKKLINDPFITLLFYQ